MSLLKQNSKMKKAMFTTHQWSLPSVKTCPMAGTCKKTCYTLSGPQSWKNVRQSYERNLDMTKNDGFIDAMTGEINLNHRKTVRIHDSGDFYDQAYQDKWMQIALNCPQTTFYAYTKMVSDFEEISLPDNVVIIYSYGGKQDHLIDPSIHRHSHIFESLADLKAAGYIDASVDDSKAWHANSHKIGLVYHGPKAKMKDCVTWKSNQVDWFKVSQHVVLGHVHG